MEEARGGERDPGEWRELSPAMVYEGPAILGKQRAALWGLVLTARSIPCVVEEEPVRVLVPESLLDAARHEIRLYEQENRNWPPPLPAVRPVAGILATLSVLLLLATFHNVTLLDIRLPGGKVPDWTGAGACDAARVASGEWWRAVTALTLHADAAHLLSNLAAALLFVIPLGAELGGGLTWLLLLAAGTSGNLANALLHADRHISIGASTAVFGALGIVAALTATGDRPRTLRRQALPIGGALALLAILGTEGVRTDIGAHLFGFVFGTGWGLVASAVLRAWGRPTPAVNRALGAVAAAILVGGWWLAVGR